MAYGDYNGPDKPDKGLENGSCNRQRCQDSPASHYNHGMYKWYCSQCAIDIGEDCMNKMGWSLNHKPKCGHDQFETRAEMDAREQAKKDAEANEPPEFTDFLRDGFPKMYDRARREMFDTKGSIKVAKRVSRISHTGGLFKKPKHNRG